MSGVTNFLVGGKKSQGKALSPVEAGSSEDLLVKNLDKELNSQYASQGNIANQQQVSADELTKLFTSHLKQFMGQTPQQQQQLGTEFVDSTFTNPAQAVVNQNLSDFQSQGAGRAAALGRNPNVDIATQQALLGETQRQNIGLQAERGSRIQSATNDIYNRGLGSLNAGMQGSGFLNSLTQQAFGNQLNLLNGMSGLSQYYQNNRRNDASNTSYNSGLLTNIQGITNAASGITKNLGSLGSAFGGGGSQGGGIGA